MKIQEVCQLLGITKKAIYYYEKQGLIHISKSNNGYRVFYEKDIQRLEEISLYRKLDIDIVHIQKLLSLSIEDKRRLMNQIYIHKKEELSQREDSLNAMKSLIDDYSQDHISDMNQKVDYESISKAIQDQIPGLYGQMFIIHFLPYLDITIETTQQEDAYHKVIDFWDHVEIRIPFLLKFLSRIEKKNKDKMVDVWQGVEKQTQSLLDDPDAYQKTLVLMETYSQKSKGFLFRVLNYPQRKFRKQLQDVGYNDIFIPAMRELSPLYNEYYTKRLELNTKVCQELGIYYDSQMRIKKKV